VRIEQLGIQRDAAHIRRPADKQGKNAGIQHSFNLPGSLLYSLGGTPSQLGTGELRDLSGMRHATYGLTERGVILVRLDGYIADQSDFFARIILPARFRRGVFAGAGRNA